MHAHQARQLSNVLAWWHTAPLTPLMFAPLQVGLLIYLPAWWQLYSGLLRVRAKKLGGSGPAKAKTA